MSAVTKVVAAGVAALLVGVVLITAVVPTPPSLDGEVTGDADLAAQVRDLAGDGRQAIAVARIEGGAVTTAALGSLEPGGSPATPSTPFEIGSITKALTGQLLVALADEGTVARDDLVADVLGRELGTATLDDLAAHAAGLPRLPTGAAPLARTFASAFLRIDPYGDDGPGAVIAAAESAGTEHRADYAYSNLGAALLGHALAEADGRPYAALLADVVLDPLGMDDTTLGVPPEGAARGTGMDGRPAAVWIAEGYEPTGVGVWSTAEDMARLVVALSEGTAPGLGAVEARADAGSGDGIGAGWHIRDVDDREVAWHNGGTGGSFSFVAVEVATGDGVVVLSNSSRPVDALGWALLGVDGDDPDADAELTTFGPWLTLIVAVGVSAMALGRIAWHRRAKTLDRLEVVAAAASGAALVALLSVGGAWVSVSVWWWIASLAALVVAVAWSAIGWSDLDTARTPGPRRWLGAIGGTVASVALLIAVVVI